MRPNRRRARRQASDYRLAGVGYERSRGSPRWWDGDNTRDCDHDLDEHGTEEVRSSTGYSDFHYVRARCGYPGCEETFDYYIEG